MAKTFTAPFAQTPKTGVTSVTNATESLIATAGADGALVTKLSAMASGTVTASRLTLHLVKSGSSTKFPIDSVTMSAYTDSATEAPEITSFERISESTPIRLEANDKLYVSCDTAQTGGVTFFAEYTDF